MGGSSGGGGKPAGAGTTGGLSADTSTQIKLATTSAIAAVASGGNLLAAGGAGIKHRLFTVIVSVDTAGTITLSDSCGAFYAGANTTTIMDYGTVGLLQGTANTAITLTNTGGGNFKACVVYRDE